MGKQLSQSFQPLAMFIWCLLCYHQHCGMRKHEEPILDDQADRAHQYQYRHWETLFNDFSLSEEYLDPPKDRTQKTADHFITAKRPFKLDVPGSAIPSTKWNPLYNFITSKIPADGAGKPSIWLKKIKDHCVRASTLNAKLLLFLGENKTGRPRLNSFMGNHRNSTAGHSLFASTVTN